MAKHLFFIHLKICNEVNAFSIIDIQLSLDPECITQERTDFVINKE